MFITNAYAAAAAPGVDLMGLAPMIIIFVLFYFMLIRPQMKQAKEHKAMVAAIKKGDEVATSGGLVGKVAKVNENFVSIEVSTETTINVQRHAVQTLLPPGTIKSI